jgi:hypothetical protein
MQTHTNKLKGMQTYLRTPVSKSLIETIEELESPWMECKFSGVKTPKTYSNSPNSSPRYSVVGVINVELADHERFLESIEKIRVASRADGFLMIETIKNGQKRQTTGNYLLKFQSKDAPEVYVLEDGQEQPIELDGEIPAGMYMKVKFEVRRYMNKWTSAYSLTFPASKVVLLPPTEQIPHSSWDRPTDAIKRPKDKPKMLPAPEPSHAKNPKVSPKKEAEVQEPVKRKRGRPKKDATLAKLVKATAPKKEPKAKKVKVEKKVKEPTESTQPKSRKISSELATSLRSSAKVKPSKK